MKASITLHEDPHKPPLLRAKIPISLLSFPFTSSFSISDSTASLSFHLRTAFSSYPSLKLSYHPSLPSNPFSLSLKSGIGLFGSPLNSPLTISISFSTPSPSFSLHFSPTLGNLTLKKPAFYSHDTPDPIPKENGGAVHRPIPVTPAVINDDIAVLANTTLPLGRHAAVKFRWGAKLPGGFMLTMNKISVESVEQEEVKRMGVSECADLEAVEEMRRESGVIKESVELVRRKVEEKGSEIGRRNVGYVKDGGAVLGKRATMAAVGR